MRPRKTNIGTNMKVGNETLESMNEPLTAPRTASDGSLARELDWEELKTIEARRREILSRSDLPLYKVLTFVEGTCLRALSGDYLLWFTLMVFVVVRLQAYFDGNLPDFANTLGHLNIDVLGGFLSFFLVLFVNQSQARFQEMFKESMNCIKRCYDIAGTVATSFPKERAQRIVRYINAAHAAGYVGLNETYSRRHFFSNINASFALLSADEMARLSEMDMDHGPDACHELVEWCMNDVQLAYDNKLIEVKDYIGLREKMLALRGSMNTLYEYNDQPIHFFYIHFLCLLSALYLPLFAVSNAYKAGAGDEVHLWADILSGLIVLVQSIFVIGLRMLGRKLVDPYGDDLEDLSVLRYVKTAWQRSNRILAARCPSDVSPQVEDEMDKRKESIGKAWESSRHL